MSAYTYDFIEICVMRMMMIYRPYGHGRVYLPFFNVEDSPFHIQGDAIIISGYLIFYCSGEAKKNIYNSWQCHLF